MNRHLRLIINAHKPWMYDINVTNCHGDCHGVLCNLLTYLSNSLNFSYNFIIESDYGVKNNGSYSGYMGHLQRNVSMLNWISTFMYWTSRMVTWYLSQSHILSNHSRIILSIILGHLPRTNWHFTLDIPVIYRRIYFYFYRHSIGYFGSFYSRRYYSCIYWLYLFIFC